ncbi:hypothetical protein [Streptomyces violens]|uniref:hypothetical protein n=1 Tax=Streptomyces violens TaxID=66377 RepID=UPI00068C1F13|nr:hypothetical protein [Streptomyces violens]
MARRHLRLTAVVAVVLLSLTGFRPHGRGSHGGDSGGGCSTHSSSSGYHGSSNHYDDDDDYDDDDYSGSGGSHSSPEPTATQAPSGRIIACANPDDARPHALVRLVVGDPHTDVTVTVRFLGADATVVDTAKVKVNPYEDDMDADRTTDNPEVRIPMAHPDRADKVVNCLLDDVS